MAKIDRFKVYNKCGGHCAYCGYEIQLKDMQVDHIESQRSGGSDDFDNLNPSCRQCNNFKSVYDLEQFRYQLSQQVTRARDKSVNFRMAEKFEQIKVQESFIIFYFEINT